MAGASLFTLLDDIAALLDDVSILTKVAAKKTAGVLGDDLALNAQQVTGVQASRELPVVWSVAKGSLLNKVILVPAALAISGWLPWLVTPLMILGGAYLSFEGVEKLAHRFLHPPEEEARRRAEHIEALKKAKPDLIAMERGKIKGAVRTDFILSAEIIVLSLGVVANQPFVTRLAVLVAIALGVTVLVYGLVAGIVKLDDLGQYLCEKGGAVGAVGRGILYAAPWLMKTLSVVGTLAMFLVGGGILVHSIPALHHVIVDAVPGGLWGTVLENLGNLVVGLLLGSAVLLGVQGIKRMRGGDAPHHA